MDIFSVISLAGGIALFLYGMSIMGSGLEKLAGGKMEGVLKTLTSTTVKAVISGAVLTGLIQSSAATTVIVIGLVNSGIMQLEQAIGVIMGANIGTTVTGQILRLSDLSGDSLALQLLKPTTIAPIVAFIGAILFVFFKKPAKRNIGQILMGFGILFTGMQVELAAMEGFGASRDDILNSLKWVDLFAPCRAGLYALCGSDDPQRCLEFLRPYFKGTLVLTLGSAGSLAFDEQNHRFEQPIFKVDTIDTTGAGDAYMKTTYLHRLSVESKLVVFLCVIIGVFLFNHPLPNLLLAALLMALVLPSGINLSGIFKALKPLIPIFILIVVMGFAKNVRQKLYYRIQDFSFANLDKFSTASLVTRLTTDVSNVQMAYMFELS